MSELIEIAGGVDCYAENAQHQDAKSRIIANPLDVVARDPDIIIGSWCGKRFHPHKVGERDGWQDVSAVKTQSIDEMKSANIVHPGPAALSDGLDQLHDIISQWHGRKRTV